MFRDRGDVEPEKYTVIAAYAKSGGVETNSLFWPLTPIGLRFYHDLIVKAGAPVMATEAEGAGAKKVWKRLGKGS